MEVIETEKWQHNNWLSENLKKERKGNKHNSEKFKCEGLRR